MSPPIDVTKFEHLKASGDLPSPKGVALAIIRLTRKDDLSLAELARVIKTPPLSDVWSSRPTAPGSAPAGRLPRYRMR